MPESDIKQTVKLLLDVRKDHRDIWNKKLAHAEMTEAEIRNQYEAINKAVRILEEVDRQKGIQSNLFAQ